MKYVSNMLFNQVWAIQQDMIDPLMEAVKRHEDGIKLSEDEIAASIAAAQAQRPARAKYKTSRVEDGTAVIQIYGLIGKRFSLFERISMDTSDIGAIKNDIDLAVNDPDVKRILLDVDSPGGTVSGVAELADHIYSMRDRKSILSVSNGQMSSAAYWIGSAASRVVTTKSSIVGSIGVYAVVSDYTVLEHNKGIKSQVVKAGRFKAAGHPQKNLTSEDVGVIQERVNTYYDLFVEGVARNRGISKEEATELANGKVWIGQQAVDMGLADEVVAMDTILGGSSGMYARADGSIDINKKSEQAQLEEESDMEIKEITLDQLRAENPDLVKQIETQALDAKSADGQAEFDAAIAGAKSEGKDEGVTAERARSAGICAHLKTAEYAPFAESAENSIKEGHTVEQAEEKIKLARLKAIDEGSVKPMSAGDGNAPKEEEEPANPHEARLKRAKAYQTEHGGSLKDAIKAVGQDAK